MRSAMIAKIYRVLSVSYNLLHIGHVSTCRAISRQFSVKLATWRGWFARLGVKEFSWSGQTTDFDSYLPDLGKIGVTGGFIYLMCFNGQSPLKAEKLGANSPWPPSVAARTETAAVVVERPAGFTRQAAFLARAGNAVHVFAARGRDFADAVLRCALSVDVIRSILLRAIVEVDAVVQRHDAISNNHVGGGRSIRVPWFCVQSAHEGDHVNKVYKHCLYSGKN